MASNPPHSKHGRHPRWGVCRRLGFTGNWAVSRPVPQVLSGTQGTPKPTADAREAWLVEGASEAIRRWSSAIRDLDVLEPWPIEAHWDERYWDDVDALVVRSIGGRGIRGQRVQRCGRPWPPRSAGLTFSPTTGCTGTIWKSASVGSRSEPLVRAQPHREQVLAALAN